MLSTALALPSPALGADQGSAHALRPSGVDNPDGPARTGLEEALKPDAAEPEGGGALPAFLGRVVPGRKVNSASQKELYDWLKEYVQLAGPFYPELDALEWVQIWAIASEVVGERQENGRFNNPPDFRRRMKKGERPLPRAVGVGDSVWIRLATEWYYGSSMRQFVRKWAAATLIGAAVLGAGTWGISVLIDRATPVPQPAREPPTLPERILQEPFDGKAQRDASIRADVPARKQPVYPNSPKDERGAQVLSPQDLYSQPADVLLPAAIRQIAEGQLIGKRVVVAGQLSAGLDWTGSITGVLKEVIYEHHLFYWLVLEDVSSVEGKGVPYVDEKKTARVLLPTPREDRGIRVRAAKGLELLDPGMEMKDLLKPPPAPAGVKSRDPFDFSSPRTEDRAGLEEGSQAILGEMLQRAGVSQARWDPVIAEDPALWRQAARYIPEMLQRDPQAFQAVVEGRGAVEIGWGLELRPGGDGTAELVAPEAGSGQSYAVYAGFADLLRQRARWVAARVLRIDERGVFYQTYGSTGWPLLEGVFLPTGLWGFLQGRGLTIDLALYRRDDAAWSELAWLLDPRTLRRNVPVETRAEDLFHSIGLQGPQGRALNALHGYISAPEVPLPQPGGTPPVRLVIHSIKDLQGRQLRVLSQVTTKLKELQEMATSPEERLDLKRALVRMGRLAEIVAGLSWRYTDLLERYVAELAEPLLAMDARTLNRILGSSTGYPILLLHRRVEAGLHFSEVNDALQFALDQGSRWEAAADSFYLPGLPILLEAHGLSAEERKRFEEMARLMTTSGWFKPDAVPNSLAYIESIEPRGADVDYAASTGWFGHPRMQLAHSGHSLGNHLNHEGEHYHLWQHPRWERITEFEQKQKVPEVRYPWEPKRQVPPSRLLAELQTHAVGVRYLLHLSNTLVEVDDVETGLLSRPRYDLARARKAIELLKGIPTFLNEEAKAWLLELEKLWQDLEAQIHDGQLRGLKRRLTSSDPKTRWDTYLNTARKWERGPAERETYLRLFAEAVSQETDPYLLWTVALFEQIPLPLREIAMRQPLFAESPHGAPHEVEVQQPLPPMIPEEAVEFLRLRGEHHLFSTGHLHQALLSSRPLKPGQRSVHLGNSYSALPLAEALMGLEVWVVDDHPNPPRIFNNIVNLTDIGWNIAHHGGRFHSVYDPEEKAPVPAAAQANHLVAVNLFDPMRRVKAISIPEAKLSIQHIADLIAPGGTVLISGQGRESWWGELAHPNGAALLREELKGRGIRFEAQDVTDQIPAEGGPTHLWLFTLASEQSSLSTAGLEEPDSVGVQEAAATWKTVLPPKKLERLVGRLRSRKRGVRERAIREFESIYRSNHQHLALETYKQARYFFGEIAGVDFPLEPEDFYQQTRPLVHETLLEARGKLSRLSPRGLRFQAYRRAYEGLRRWVGGIWGLDRNSCASCLARVAQAAGRLEVDLSQPEQVSRGEMVKQLRQQMDPAERRQFLQAVAQVRRDAAGSGIVQERPGGLMFGAQDRAAEEPWFEMLRQEDAAELRKLLKSLRHREGEVLKLRYGLVDGETYTLKEIGKIFGMTQEAIRHIEVTGMEKLAKAYAGLPRAGIRLEAGVRLRRNLESLVRPATAVVGIGPTQAAQKREMLRVLCFYLPQAFRERMFILESSPAGALYWRGRGLLSEHDLQEVARWLRKRGDDYRIQVEYHATPEEAASLRRELVALNSHVEVTEKASGPDLAAFLRTLLAGLSGVHPDAISGGLLNQVAEDIALLIKA